MLKFDRNGDGKVGRDEITGHFTWPLRPELPLGHPGWGIPLPSDPERRRQRQQGVFGWADKNRDDLWTEEELTTHISNRPGKPILMAIKPGGKRGTGQGTHRLGSSIAVFLRFPPRSSTGTGSTWSATAAPWPPSIRTRAG